MGQKNLLLPPCPPQGFPVQGTEVLVPLQPLMRRCCDPVTRASETPPRPSLRGCVGGPVGGQPQHLTPEPHSACSFLTAFRVHCMLFQPLGSGADRPRAAGWDHGHAPVAAVLGMLLVPGHLLKSILSHFHHRPTKGRACSETPGSFLRLFESFPAMFLRSALCTLPARTK